jgi:GNAT superfamily N-acetyltransferase
MHRLDIDLFSPTDAEAVTALLHRAYGRLARMGLRYWATHQSVEDTMRRASRGACWVARSEGRIVGTIVVMPSDPGAGVAWYARPDVATFGQFAVEPALQAHGIGSVLLERAERDAIGLGARELACDTADHATHLIAWYTARGYRMVGHVDYRLHTDYCSVILSKTLPAAQPSR